MRALKILMILSYFIVTGCSVNILNEFGDATTDKALLFDAQMLIDDGDWTGAINKFADMSTDFRASRDVRVLEASAYAGRCGLDFLEMIDLLANLGATKLFLQLMTDYPGSDAQDISDCVQAETLLKTIDPDATDRTTDENFLMTFVEFAKIGAILSTYADANLPYGTTEWVSGDACLVGKLSDANANEVGVAIANAIASLTEIAATSTVGGTQLTDFTTFCTAISTTPGLGASYNFCTALNTTDMTANMRTAVRSIIQENQYVGIGSCNNTLANCVCP